MATALLTTKPVVGKEKATQTNNSIVDNSMNKVRVKGQHFNEILLLYTLFFSPFSFHPAETLTHFWGWTYKAFCQESSEAGVCKVTRGKMKQADWNFSFHWTICSPTQGKSWSHLDFGDSFSTKKNSSCWKSMHVCYKQRTLNLKRAEDFPSVKPLLHYSIIGFTKHAKKTAQ